MTRRADPFLTYVAAFHLAWVAWPFVVYPRLSAIGDATLTYALLNIGLRLLRGVMNLFPGGRRATSVAPVL